MRSRLLVGLVTALIVFAIGSPLAAHSEIRFRAPAAGQTVGGVVDHIDLQFWTPVESGEITLIDHHDAEIAVSETTLSPTGTITSVDFEPLDDPGVYTVTHTELSDDGDEQTASYTFIFDPESGERVEDLLERGSGPNWLLLGGIAVVIGGLAFLFAPNRK